MTKQLTNLFLACSATCIMGLALNAESYLSKATVPFAFQVDGKTMQSGDYLVRESANDVVSIRGAKTGQGMFVSSHAGEKQGKGPARLVFHRYGDRYFLAEVWSPAQQGTVLKPTKAEKELMVSGERQEAAVITLNLRAVTD